MVSGVEGPVLVCERLRKSFGRTVALDDVNLEFRPHGVTALIGPNGAGKTTLLDVISGFQSPDSGRCLLDDSEVTRLAPYRIARLGIARTFQDLRLASSLPPLDNVLLATQDQRDEGLLRSLLSFGGTTESLRRRSAADLLLTVGIDPSTACSAGDLSYGQQKLLTLACCMAAKPRILLLDEPLSGVDPKLALKIMELLRGIANDGRSVIVVEHDLAAVREFADHVVLMVAGRMMAHGSPDVVLQGREVMDAYVL